MSTEMQVAVWLVLFAFGVVVGILARIRSLLQELVALQRKQRTGL